MPVKNPRFPHHCTIYRIDGETSFNDGEKVVIYDGKCNRYGATSLRTFRTNFVVKGDYAIDLPGLVTGIDTGCFVDFEDYVGEFKECVVTDCYPTHMGTTLQFNLPKQ